MISCQAVLGLWPLSVPIVSHQYLQLSRLTTILIFEYILRQLIPRDFHLITLLFSGQKIISAQCRCKVTLPVRFIKQLNQRLVITFFQLCGRYEKVTSPSLVTFISYLGAFSAIFAIASIQLFELCQQGDFNKTCVFSNSSISPSKMSPILLFL